MEKVTRARMGLLTFIIRPTDVVGFEEIILGEVLLENFFIWTGPDLNLKFEGEATQVRCRVAAVILLIQLFLIAEVVLMRVFAATRVAVLAAPPRVSIYTMSAVLVRSASVAAMMVVVMVVELMVVMWVLRVVVMVVVWMWVVLKVRVMGVLAMTIDTFLVALVVFVELGGHDKMLMLLLVERFHACCAGGRRGCRGRCKITKTLMIATSNLGLLLLLL